MPPVGASEQEGRSQVGPQEIGRLTVAWGEGVHLVGMDDVEILFDAPRFALARWPTPIERSSSGVWIKRDDLCGYGRGGAKARKIEHVLGHLLDRGFDELITVAGNVTNIGFDLLPAVDQAGIGVHLLIADDPPAPQRSREEIFEGILDRVHLIGPSRIEALRCAFTAYRRSRRAGRKPFLLLPGGSHPAAIIGNACGFIEMVEQFRSRGIDPPRTVFITAATGNTIGGFLVGENALRARGYPPIRIVGVQVYPGPVRRMTWMMIRWTERVAGLHGRVPYARVEIDDNALQGGFGRFTEEIALGCTRVQDDVGISIDPIFGGKTWHVMEREIAEGRVEAPVLFWHCGYTPEWRELATRLEAPAGAP